MIYKHSSDQSGFSAIELLITLFVAAAFIGTGYQLYSVILKNGGDTKQRTTANDLAYEGLRRYASRATIPCTALPSQTITIPADAGLSNTSGSNVTYTCPYGSTDVTMVKARVVYGSPQQEVVHVTYVNGN